MSDGNQLDDEFSDLVPCPHCGTEIYEDSDRCPACGDYVIHETHALSGRPLWWIILGILGVIAVILVLASGY